MNQTQWNARVAARNTACGGCLWQYFKMDDASGLPQDSSGNAAHMNAGTGSAYGVPGPFSGAEAITISGKFESPVSNPPTNTVNYGHPKTMECWVKFTGTPDNLRVLIGLGNIVVLITTDQKLQLLRSGVTLGPTGTTVLSDDTWYFVMLTSFDSLGLRLYINETEELEWDPAAWPIPNAILGEVGEPGGWTPTISNAAFYDTGELTPDFPHTPQLVSMNAVIPTAGP